MNTNYDKMLKTIKSLGLCVCVSVLGCIGLASCDDTQSSGNILDNFVQEVNNKDNNNEYKIINSREYFAICYYIKNTPENKAKLLLLCHNQELASMFKNKILNNLDKGEVLTQIIKEKKGLVYALCCGDLEYHVYYPPEEIYSKYYRQ